MTYNKRYEPMPQTAILKLVRQSSTVDEVKKGPEAQRHNRTLHAIIRTYSIL